MADSSGAVSEIQGIFLGKNDYSIEPFQSACIPLNGTRQYLCHNMVGTICAIIGEDQNQMDVSFHDSAQRPFHFSCTEQYDMGALGSAGAIFACPSTSFSVFIASTLISRCQKYITDRWITGRIRFNICATYVRTIGL